MTNLPTPQDDQEHLAQVLRDRDARFGCSLADVYVGAVMALNDASRPDHLSHAAHGIRELLDLLPKYYDGAPVRLSLANVAQHLRDIERELRQAKERSACFSSVAPSWKGEIDEHLKRLLDRVEEAVQAASGPSRRDVFQAFLRSLDPLGPVPVPSTSERPIPEWTEHRRYFNAVAHHEVQPTVQECREKLTACTRWLLRELRPPTLETRNILDEIIRGAE